MKVPRRRFLGWTVGGAAMLALPRIARGQSYPTRPVTMIVPVPAGGQMDSAARLLAERMRISLGQPIVIENVTGASGTIGVGRVARAEGDGYTLLYGAWATQVVNGAVYSLAYDPINDFEPIALTTISPWLIAAKVAVPANDLSGLIGWLRANPHKATAGTSGAGGPGHIGGILFQQLSNTRFEFVPYRGMTPAMQDLVSGQIDIMIADPASAIPQLRAGRIKVFAVAAKTRSTAAPDVPTVDEAGLPGFYLAPWHGMWAPKRTPAAVIARLNAAVVDTLSDLEVQQRLGAIGSEISAREQQTPEGLKAFHQAEIERWWPIIKSAGIKPG
jgi:tripartite-type tricarboxylate transporter receptor subunit TctC